MSYDLSGQCAGISDDLAGWEWTFEEWTAHLRAAGFRLCPASCGVPVELRGLRPDGFGFHLRCRGVRMTLSVFRPGRAMWQFPYWDPTWTPEEGLSLWVNYPADYSSWGGRAFENRIRSVSDGDGDGDSDVIDSGPARPGVVPGVVPGGEAVFDRARLFFEHEDVPDHQVVFDGGRERGWRGHEAGLLRPGEAAKLFARLMAEADAAAGVNAGVGLAVARLPRARVGEPRLIPARCD
ncbi:hypothetical protein [Frankia sp. Cj3]|uniref:hypothetical protein n=2 Tax=unclassified Frankia TaxID=2632575 RepID=UPI001EF65CA5|nr:hypothetical protein [Frankia sp. Cj3]